MLLQWFGEQSEAVKLALIGLVSAFGAGVFGIFKEWRKPVLDAKSPTPVAVRPSDDDPFVLLAASVEGMNFALAEIKRSIDTGAARHEDLISHIEKLNEELRDIRQEIVVAQEVLRAGK